MSSIGRRDTKPEIAVRRLAHSLGFRFRLHRRDLPGTPDIVFPRLRKVIFVHGCWWHRHAGCSKAAPPKSNAAFWEAKFERNVRRDERVTSELEASGWRVGVIWECETRHVDRLEARLITFLGPIITPAAE
jgi:DNA mismatch endonuclease (patch repair protein)